MKIKKFNESNVSIGNLEKVANIETEIVKLKRELQTAKKELFPLLAEYLFLNPQLQEDQDIEIDENEITIEIIRRIDRTDNYFKNSPDDAIYELVYYPDGSAAEQGNLESAFMNAESIKDLEIFLNNPDTYKDAKKYNL